MTEELVWELFTQAGPIGEPLQVTRYIQVPHIWHIAAAAAEQLACAANIYLPKDRVTNQHMGYGFVEFRSEDDADYVRPAALLQQQARLTSQPFS